MKYRFIQAGRCLCSREMAGVPRVSAGACYKRAKHGVPERRSKTDAELLSLTRRIVTEHHFRYGSPRVRREMPADTGRG